MKRFLLFLVFLILTNSLAIGQSTFKIRGKVTDQNGEPLIGASVVLKATGLGAAADLDGNYSFDVPKSLANGQQTELTASFINYKKGIARIVLNGSEIVQDFSLEEDVFQNEEIVVTGIASKTSKSVAEVSVARINAADLQTINSYNGISQIVAGKVSGVQMTNASGNVGGGWRFNVRGGGGLNGTGQPTMYIDGVRVENTEIGLAAGGQLNNTLSGLNANDIDKIEFLKGPAAAAMYGTNGANGVVLITTKTGKISAAARKGLSVEYKFNYGYNEQQRKYDSDVYVTADTANNNFRKGPIREHFLNIVGGNSEVRYYASLENRIEDGILATNRQERTSTRINLVANPYNNLNIKLNAYYNNNKVFRPNNDNSIYGWLGNMLLRYKPFTWTSRVMLDQAYLEGTTNQFIGSVSANYTPIENLEINATLGVDNMNYRENRFYPIGYNALVADGQKALYDRRNTNQNMEFNAAYNYEFSDFKFRSVVGAQFFNRYLQGNNVTVEDFNSTLITDLGSGGTVTTWAEQFLHAREGGIFTEHSISYQDQYFLTLGIRKDYATSIGDNAPSITYPKASFAVRLDKYDFLPSFVNLLKLRAAYGEGGVLPGVTDGIPLLWDAQVGGYGAGAAIAVIGNDKIEPERVKEIEVGFDAELFKNVSLEVTYYKTDAEKSIVNRVLAGSTGKLQVSTGSLAQPYNLGKVTGSGFESLLQYSPIRGNEFNLDLSLIWNYQTNKIEDLGGTGDIINTPNAHAVGYSKSRFYAFVPVAPIYSSSTGKYIGATLSTERRDLGSPIPDHSGSFSVNFKFFKNFNLYAFAEWGLNNKISNGSKQFASRLGGVAEVNRYRALLGLSAAYPGAAPAGVVALTPGTDEYKKVAEEYMKVDGLYEANFVEDASYLIIREVSFSYDFSDLFGDLALNTYLKSVTAGVSVRNLVTFSEYKDGDPGVNFSGARQNLAIGQEFLTLPTPRTFNFWLRLGF